MNSGSCLKVCLNCANVFSVTLMTKSKKVCSVCKGILVPYLPWRVEGFVKGIGLTKRDMIMGLKDALLVKHI